MIRTQSHTRTCASLHSPHAPSYREPTSNATPTTNSYTLLGTPRSFSAFHTPVSPRGGLPPHLASHMNGKSRTLANYPIGRGASPHLLKPQSDVATKGRRRSATVSGNGQADLIAHPDAALPLPHVTGEPLTRYAVSPSPPAHGKTAVRSTPEERVPGRRRSTVSGHIPFDSAPPRGVGMSSRIGVADRGAELGMPTKEEFVRSAEWLWGVMERTERLLQGIKLRDGDSPSDERRGVLPGPSL